jgi:DNA-binding protein H-NS
MNLLNKVNELNFQELVSLREAVDAEIKARQSEERAKAKKQIVELAKAFNIDAAEILGKRSTVVRKPVEAKYRHPSDASLTWTGRGRKPSWVQEQLDKGVKLEALQIHA